MEGVRRRVASVLSLIASTQVHRVAAIEESRRRNLLVAMAAGIDHRRPLLPSYALWRPDDCLSVSENRRWMLRLLFSMRAELLSDTTPTTRNCMLKIKK